jgi:hypothetical protein
MFQDSVLIGTLRKQKLFKLLYIVGLKNKEKSRIVVNTHPFIIQPDNSTAISIRTGNQHRITAAVAFTH